MEKRNQKLTIIVGALLIVIGVSFSYFLATTLINGNGASTKVTTARINGATLNVEGTLEFDDTGILPGHKNVSAIKVTATGNNQLIAYNLIWKGTSEISQINYTVYKSSTPKTISTNCSNKTSVANGMQVLSEECSVNNIDTLGEAIASGSIRKGDTKVTLALDEFITATSDGQTVYYYIILEYPNLDIDQSGDVDATFEGEVTVEESNIKPDINIIAAYVKQDNGEYQEVEDIPSEGYAVNTSKSTCSNGARPTGVSPKITINNLSKSGTSCYIYLDKAISASTIVTNIIASAKTEQPDFSQIATTDEGVYAAEDGMHGGTSYYWRGAATTNYLKFANFCWRIIRINGDGTIRLIYDGSSCHANGESTTDSIAVSNVSYNINHNQSNYVGWTYIEGKQRPSNNEIATSSNAKVELDNWYLDKLQSYDSFIANGKYCNDRNVQSGSIWTINGGNFSYASSSRINGSPTLNCTSEDIYVLKAGLITTDEVNFAGGKFESNTSYYLYNGQYYWTMSSNVWYEGIAHGFRVDENGQIGGVWASTPSNLRPVINLRQDILISGGDGSIDSPFVVVD